MFKKGGLGCGRNSQANGFILLNTNAFVLAPNYLLYMIQCSYKDKSTIGFWESFSKMAANAFEGKFRAGPISIYFCFYML